MPKPGRMGDKGSRPWVAARKWIQILTFLIFTGLLIGASDGRISGSVANLPLRLDPLTSFSNLLASRKVLAGSALALLTVGLTIVAGRAWCGWLCPLGSLLDFFSLSRWRPIGEAPPESWRRVKYALLLVILVAAIFTSLTLLIFDPLTLFIRTFTVAFWPALDRVITSVETSAYRLPALRPAVSAFDGLIRPSLLPQSPLHYRGAAFFGVIFSAIVLLNLLAERFWCRYLCPLGAMLGLISKIAILRRVVPLECVGCDLCAPSCPTGTIRPEHGYVSDPGECTMCMTCMYACPENSATFTPKVGLSRWEGYDPGRRMAIASLGTAIVGVALLRVDKSSEIGMPPLLRPPGAEEGALLAACLRCGECIRTCPTGGLQPAPAEVGLEGLWTPMLVPRLGYCDYGCNACGLSCPVEAIPPLSLGEKRIQVLGRAYIDEDRCIAWADETPCIVCEEMCPLPEKAITLEEVQILDGRGHAIPLLRPEVIRERCIGCGICEFKCPVEGQAAIRVHLPGTLQPTIG